MNLEPGLNLSLQHCLASRKDCSGEGRILPKTEILEICKSTSQAAPSKPLFLVLPDSQEYSGGIYSYQNQNLTLITNKEKTKYSMELYPGVIWKESIPLNELIEVGLIWQYLSLKVESLGLGISQRAKVPKKINKLVNDELRQNYTFFYSVAVRERDREGLIEDKLGPFPIEVEENKILLETPSCYEDYKIYKNQYVGVPLEIAIFNQLDKKAPNQTSLHEISQLLWACQGETDHATHGNRDPLEKNGYGRVHASGCAGYAVYPIVIVENLANLPKGSYVYNPMGYSVLNRWVKTNNKITYDHFLQRFSSESLKLKLKNEFEIGLSSYAILLSIDRKKPCAGFMHKIMNLRYWAEIEAGMALAGLQLQANALGLKWKKIIMPNPDDSKYRDIFNLDDAELMIKSLSSNIVNPVKNEKLSLKGNLIPTVLFFIQD
ncbi:MAG: hypothetical protein ACFFKA_10690 [Candidatus Thorarchaeota archaeon]